MNLGKISPFQTDTEIITIKPVQLKPSLARVFCPIMSRQPPAGPNTSHDAVTLSLGT